MIRNMNVFSLKSKRNLEFVFGKVNSYSKSRTQIRSTL
ncbi:hypothetical protein LEP1GSC029_0133 [Leptospira interrogans str. 2002000626]|uniref:Uncharacterized protein n=1 Tax=Leptospira interrogans str. 2002000626 TaxID=996803 RepID=A0A829CQ68_LEPIR|nr:hypothetical protein LEP1GSC029_0133 [Leptospira interrogans str. 2002000626]